MNFRTASLASLSVLLGFGVVFFFLSFGLPLSEPGLVIGSGYYPRALSLLMIVGSAAGLITSYRNKASKKVSISITKPKYFFFVLGLALLLAAVWHATGSFYPICSLAVLALLWFLNPEPPSPRKAVKSLLIAAVLMGFVFVVFGLLLQLNL